MALSYYGQRYIKKGTNQTLGATDLRVFVFTKTGKRTYFFVSKQAMSNFLRRAKTYKNFVRYEVYTGTSTGWFFWYEGKK